MSVPVATALVVVDVQRAFLDADPPLLDPDGLLDALSVLLAAARGAGAAVVHVQDLGDADSRFPLGLARELVLPVRAGEHVVAKTGDDAFAGTGLADVLEGHRVVAVGGLQSEMCVAATVRGALARGRSVVLPHDAHSTYDVPAGPAGPAVPAEVVRRVAAWSLGDQVSSPLTSAEVRFAAVTP